MFDPEDDDGPVETTVLLDADTMDKTLHRMAQSIVADNPDLTPLVFLGILRRGKPLADRLARHIGWMTGVTPPVGALATTLYRDDFPRRAARLKTSGETYFDFNIDGRLVLLVDDVLAAGRTIRAAMDEVMHYGRPMRIQLACLVDRGRRELPIQPDYLGWTVATGPDDWVAVHLTAIDGEDAVLLHRRPGEESAADAAAEHEA